MVRNLFTQALLHRQLLGMLRRPRPFWILGALILLLSGAYVLSYRIEATLALRLQDPTDLGRKLLYGYAQFCYVALCLFVPLVGVQTIAAERDRYTLESLLTTPLTPRALVVSKIAAGLFVVLCGLAGGSPLLAVTLLMGGVGPNELASMFLQQVSLALFGLAVGIWAGACAKGAFRALILAYATFAILLLVPVAVDRFFELLLRHFGVFLDRATASNTKAVIVYVLGSPAFLLAIGWYLMSRASERLGREPKPARSRTWSLPRLKGRDSQLWSLLGVRDRDELIPDGQNPVYACERHRFLVQVAGRYVDAPSLLWIGAAFGFYWLATQPVTMLYSALLLLLIFVPPLGSGILNSERERGTWDLLKTTLLDADDILRGKLQLVFRQALIHVGAFYLPTLPLLLFFWLVVLFIVPALKGNTLILASLARENLFPLWSAHLLIIPILIGTAYLFTSLSVWCSVRFQRPWIAAFMAYILVLAFLTGPRVGSYLFDIGATGMNRPSNPQFMDIQFLRSSSFPVRRVGIGGPDGFLHTRPPKGTMQIFLSPLHAPYLFEGWQMLRPGYASRYDVFNPRAHAFSPLGLALLMQYLFHLLYLGVVSQTVNGYTRRLLRKELEYPSPSPAPPT